MFSGPPEFLTFSYYGQNAKNSYDTKMAPDARLDRAQRRAVKIVLKTRDAGAEKNLKWLPLSIRRDMNTVYSTLRWLHRVFR